MTAAILLAAGGGRRLGQIKPLLTHHGTPLVQRAVTAAREVGCRPIVVVTGFGESQVLEVLAGQNVLTVSNPRWERGIASSIRTGVAALGPQVGSTRSVLLLVCDQPALDASVLGRLLATHDDHADRITACEYAETCGTPAVFGVSWLDDLRSLRGDTGARQIFERAGDRLHRVVWPAGANDVDCPEDLHHLDAPPDG
ncbi:MAG: nucleotidyltransferase family protein [Acidobacteriota bacterium]|nr:nucleotidyltransferase family protein [Acidobacteriota bacterium]MDH3786255.1 nucleotidyltransferase family protein [Acidobacteriota bacterium]